MRRSSLALAALCWTAPGAEAVGFKTQFNCASDYYAYCSRHSVGTPELRNCMRANGPRLSKACINALIEDGEVSRAEVERQKEKLTAAKAKPKPSEPAKSELAAAKASVNSQANVSLNKTAPKQPKANVATAPGPRKPQAAQPPVTHVAEPVQAKAQAAARQTVALDQSTFEALKNRGSRFLAEEQPPAPPVQAEAPQPPSRSDVTAAGRADTSPVPPADGDAAVAAEPAAEVETLQAETAEAAELEQPPRPAAYPEGRMSLGRNLSSPQPQPMSWWDELVRAITGE